MAPVTRRAAKALVDDESILSVTENDTSILEEQPIVLRSKRTKTDDAGDDDDAKNGDNNNNSSAKKTRAKIVATPKRKKLEVRLRGDSTGATRTMTTTSVKTEIEIEIPTSSIKTPRPVRSSPVPDSQETTGSDKDDADPLSASKQLEEEASHKLASRARRLAAGHEVTPLAKIPARKSIGKSGLQAQTVDSEPEAEAEAETTPQPKAVPKSKHVVFGDDDDVDKFVAAAAETAKEARDAKPDSDEEEESDDEAPEAVSTATAVQETLKSARAAIDAAEKYAASTKRKRQERETLLKDQAEKRKRTRPTKPSTSENEDSSEDEKEQNPNPSKRRRQNNNRTDLPDMLPEEFLTDSSDDEGDETALKKMVQRPQKITFETALQVLGAEGKGPRDTIVGSTRYRVMAEKSDDRLPPKADKNSSRAKQALLRRGRVGVQVNKKRGFFVR